MPEHQTIMQEAEPLPDGFKTTELGPLPEEWWLVSSGDVFERQHAKPPSPKSRNGSQSSPFRAQLTPYRAD